MTSSGKIVKVIMWGLNKSLVEVIDITIYKESESERKEKRQWSGEMVGYCIWRPRCEE